MNKEITLENVEIATLSEAVKAIDEIDCTKAGTELMKYKAVFKPIKLTNLDVRGANILKQTFLSKGGEVVVSCHCADFTAKTTDVLILATLHQYRLAIPVLHIQPWGLKEVAVLLEKVITEEYAK